MKLLALALLHFVLQGQTCLLPQVSLDFLFLHLVPYDEKDIFFLVFILEGLVNFSFFGISCWGIDSDYRDIEWFALERDRDHSVVFEIAPKYCTLDSFVDYNGSSFSSTGFLPTVVDIMAI